MSCPDCNEKMINSRSAGHNKRMENTHFDLCNQAVEIPQTIRSLELSGKIKTPEKIAWAKAMIEKSKTAEKIDYQKVGHPSLDR